MSTLELLNLFTNWLDQQAAEDEAIDREAALAAEVADYYHLGYSQF